MKIVFSKDIKNAYNNLKSIKMVGNYGKKNICNRISENRKKT